MSLIARSVRRFVGKAENPGNLEIAGGKEIAQRNFKLLRG
jgi:hypothetical protein